MRRCWLENFSELSAYTLRSVPSRIDGACHLRAGTFRLCCSDDDDFGVRYKSCPLNILSCYFNKQKFETPLLTQLVLCARRNRRSAIAMTNHISIPLGGRSAEVPPLRRGGLHTAISQITYWTVTPPPPPMPSVAVAIETNHRGRDLDKGLIYLADASQTRG